MPSNEHSLNPADDTVADDPAESCWLKEAKTALRALDPGEASEDASALSRWAYLRWRNIMDAEEADLRNFYNLGYHPDD